MALWEGFGTRLRICESCIWDEMQLFGVKHLNAYATFQTASSVPRSDVLIKHDEDCGENLTLAADPSSNVSFLEI